MERILRKLKVSLFSSCESARFGTLDESTVTKYADNLNSSAARQYAAVRLRKGEMMAAALDIHRLRLQREGVVQWLKVGHYHRQRRLQEQCQRQVEYTVWTHHQPLMESPGAQS